MSHSHGLDKVLLARMCSEIGVQATEAAVAAFRTEMSRRARLLRTAADADDMPTLRRLLHQVKGSALTFGAAAVAHLATEADARARAGELSPTIELARLTATAIDELGSTAGEELPAAP